LECF